MGVFKWLRRERVSITSRRSNTTGDNNDEGSAESVSSPKNGGTIRTEEYKRDLAEFQARRSSGNYDAFETPNNKPKKKSARNSLPCTNCNSDLADNSFNYEKTSATKYQSNKRRTSMEERVPNIQFLFSNQVFMPGDVFTRNAFSEVQHSKKMSVRRRSPDFRVTRQKINFEQEEHDQNITLTCQEIFEERATEKQTEDDEHFELNQQIDFEEEDDPTSPPLFFKNNSLPFEVNNFLNASYSEDSLSDIVNRDTSTLKSDVINKNNLVAPKTNSPNNDKKLEEVLDELRSFDQWADEQLRMQQSINSSKSDESKYDSSYNGLPLVASSAIDLTEPETKGWNYGHWGVVAVHVKKLTNVTLGTIRKRQCVEVNILRKCRHPNIILLMGLYSDVQNNLHLICERFVATLHDIIHLKGRILSAQTSVSYALDIASALVFLQMHGYLHTNLNSTNVMVTHCDMAKLTDLDSCVTYERDNEPVPPGSKTIAYAPEPIYMNLKNGRYPNDNQDYQPLISAHPSDATMPPSSVSKQYSIYEYSETFRWHPPELFQPDDAGLVYPCSRSDVYALSLVLWECCNAALPWKTLSYEKLSNLYLVWKTGIRLPQDGTYPGCLLELLQNGLKLDRSQRMSLDTMVERLDVVKTKLSDMEDILIPARISRKRSEFSSVAWELNSMSDVDFKTSTIDNNHKAQIHRETSDSSSHREEELNSQLLEKEYQMFEEPRMNEPERCYVSESDDDRKLKVVYDRLLEREYSSTCSTPFGKKRVTLRDIGTPGENLHKSDSTEYCSIFSPENRNFLDDSINKSTVNSSAKLCQSFTPKSYKSLHIKVPAVENLENLKTISKGSPRKGSYHFDIKNSSLPTTPIARSNKLRKNAWLSGDVNECEKKGELRIEEDSDRTEPLTAVSAPQITILHDKEIDNDAPQHNGSDECQRREGSTANPESPSFNSDCDTCGSLKRIAHGQEFSFDTYPSTLEHCRSRSYSWSSNPGSSLERTNSTRPTDGVLEKVNVKPLVEFHERWISEANKKYDRLMAPPDTSRPLGPPVKPASHSVDTLQTSVPQLNVRSKQFRSNVTMSPTPSYNGRRGSQSEQYCNIRDKIGRSMSFPSRDPDRYERNIWKKEQSKCIASMSQTTSSIENELNHQDTKEASRNTSSLDDFIRQLIQKEFYQLLDQVTHENEEELVQKGTDNVLNAIKSDTERSSKENLTKSFSRVKINGNNKPLIQITFNRTGENSLQVLDSCVNVTICDSNTKMDKGEEQYSSKDDLRSNSLKRCQAFNAIQEARSTEDLYIDDDLSTHMEENFCGNMKLIPLHGSLHEILCEKADDCCLVKVKQENGCDKMYFMCQNHGSKDAIDGCDTNAKHHDKVVFKRSISLIEERYERVYPKDKKPADKTVNRRPSKENTQNKVASVNKRPKSEIIYNKVSRDPKVYSSSSPSVMCSGEKFSSEDASSVVNIENLMGYQDSSSDESVKSQNDDFEEIEKKIEEDFAMTAPSKVGFLEKISEENLSVNGEISEKESCVSKLNEKIDLDMEYRKSRSCEELY